MFGTRRSVPARPTARPRAALGLEPLENRTVPTSLAVNVTQPLRAVNAHLLSTNLAWWDSSLNTAQTQQMVESAGLTLYRFPGGSSSDTYHFNNPPSYQGYNTAPVFASFIQAVNGAGMVTLDYGSGSPQEAAAFLAYLNAPVGNTTAIGLGEQWSTTSNSWVNQDWQTAGYWSGLRAAAPLAHDDGLNFLRLSHPAPFAMHYYEIGNEIYGSWETDHHGQGGDTGRPHDPTTYVSFATQFAAYAATIDPSIEIGLCSGGIGNYSDWIDHILQTGLSQGFIPGFISDHSYMQAPGHESDATLLLHTVTDPHATDPTDPHDWIVRAADYRAALNRDLGASAGSVELLATEFNSVYSNPGKQSTSLVNGLFLADSLGVLLQTEYNAGIVWDLRNGWDTGNNNSSSLYGWRQGGDYGLLGSGSGPLPSTGRYAPYPNYFAEQLLSQMVHTGDTVVTATSDDPTVSVYAVLQQTGHLDLLVINKNPSSDLTIPIQLSGFQPTSQAQVWQYSEAEDTAQSHTSDGHSALSSYTPTLNLNGSSFSYTFPRYSMTGLDLTRAPLIYNAMDTDIGNPARTGFASSDGTTDTVLGGGNDIWNTSDQFHFAYTNLGRDGILSVQALSVSNTDPWAKGGLMLRASTAANAAFADVVLTPGNGVAFQWRPSTGASPSNVNIPGVTGPVWLALQRAGNQVSAFYSLDDVNWNPIGTSQTVNIGTTPLAGLAVTAHNVSQLAAGIFQNVGFQASASPAAHSGGSFRGAEAVLATGAGDQPAASTDALVSIAGAPAAADAPTVPTLLGAEPAASPSPPTSGDAQVSGAPPDAENKESWTGAAFTDPVGASGLLV